MVVVGYNPLHRTRQFWLGLILEQNGKCKITGAKLFFNVKYGTPVRERFGCHPLYATVDHIIPGREDGGLQIVCQDINDLKAHLPKPLFDALKNTKKWLKFSDNWKKMAEPAEIAEKRGIFKMLVKLGEPLKFCKSTKVAKGVECDIYKFVGDDSKDLGIIRIKAGCKTPLQKVLKGERTVEGFISGKGRLVVTASDGEQKIYNGEKGLAVDVKIGELMQWQAVTDSELEVYEICFPPYKDGRFENIQ